MNYMVSSHGGRYTNTSQITLPANVTVKFFVLDEGELSNDENEHTNAWGIYDRFLEGLGVNDNQQYFDDRVVETVAPGGQVYNYACWNMSDLGLEANSGIYDQGGNRINALNNTLNLDQVIGIIRNATAAPVTIYWAACREVSQP